MKIRLCMQYSKQVTVIPNKTSVAINTNPPLQELPRKYAIFYGHNKTMVNQTTLNGQISGGYE